MATTLQVCFAFTFTCARASNYTLVGRFDGFLQVEPRDELALMEAVYTLGPLSVAIDPSPDSFAFYKEGVFWDKTCSINDLDHQVGVLLACCWTRCNRVTCVMIYGL